MGQSLPQVQSRALRGRKDHKALKVRKALLEVKARQVAKVLLVRKAHKGM
jgi:hypothetical protein